MEVGVTLHEMEEQAIPSMGSAAACGFPSPADDYVEGFLSLDGFLGVSLEGMRLLRVEGGAWQAFGVLAGDVLVVDVGCSAPHGAWVLVQRQGQWSLLRDAPPSLDVWPHLDGLVQSGTVVGLIRVLV